MTREEAIKILKAIRVYECYPKSASEETKEAIDMAIEALSDRTGEWIFNPKDAIELMFTKPKCSKCGFESSDGGNYCPNCGADMRGEQDG